VSAAEALRDLLAEAAELGARKALEQVQSTSPARLVPLKQASISYRNLLELIRAGELKVFGCGNRKFVDREAVEQWLLNHPITNLRETTEETVEIDELVASNRARKAKRAKGAK